MYLPTNSRALLFPLTLFVVATIFQTSLNGQDGGVDQTFKPNLERLDGVVYVARSQPDGKVVVGGSFQFVNAATRINLARLNADGTNDETFNVGDGPDRQVYSVAFQPDGKIIVGGLFGRFDGRLAGSIVRLNSNGTVDTTFNCPGTVSPGNTTYVVSSLVVQPDGKIVAAGNFANFNGQTANDIIRLNPDGSVDGSFASYSVPSNGRIAALEVLPDGRMNMALTYSIPPGEPRSQVVRLFPNGLVDSSFSASIINSNITTIAVDAGENVLVAANSLTASSPLPLFRLTANGGFDSSFSAAPSSTVHSILAEPDGKIIVGGEFAEVAGVPRGRIARLNFNGGLDTTFDSNADIDYHVVALLRLGDGKLLVGGRNTNFPIPGKSRLTRHNADGTVDTSFTTKLRSTDTADVVVALPDGKMLVGGAFTAVNGVERSAIARLNNDGTLDNSFQSNANWSVKAIAVQSDGKILIGGTFDSVNGSFRLRVARLNPNGSLDSSFDPGSNFDGGTGVSAIVPLTDGKILVGGAFYQVNGNAKGLLRLNADGTHDTSFNAGFESQSADVRVIVPQPDGKIMIGGSFIGLQGTTRRQIARLNSNGSLDAAFQAPQVLNPTITAIVLQPDGKILIGGSFLALVNDVEWKNLMRLNPNGALDDTFRIGTGFSNGSVNAVIRQSDGKILVGGGFPSYDGVPAKNFIRLLDTGAIDSSFQVGGGMNGNVNSIALLSNGNILVGGLFSDVQGYFHAGVARLRGTPISQARAPFDFDGDGKTDLSIFRPNGAASEWWWNKSSTGGNAALQFGSSTDKLAPVDFTGDGKTDVAFWRPSTGQWFVLRSEDFSFYAFPFGAAGDVPVPADYDGDGKADAAVFRESTLTWYINKSSGGTDIVGFGAVGDKPVNADYDGDGKADIAIFRPTGASGAEWWVRRSSNASVFALQFGSSSDKAVPGDFTGDGKADVAFWRPSTGAWNILRSEDLSYYAFPFGASGDIASPGDYDGDGKTDAAVFRSSSSTWFANKSGGGTLIQQFGIAGDVPLPSAFVR